MGKNGWGYRWDKIDLLKLDNGYMQVCYTILFTSVYFETFSSKKFQFQKEIKVHCQFFCHKYESNHLIGRTFSWVNYSGKTHGNSNPWGLPCTVWVDITSLAHTFFPWDSDRYCFSSFWDWTLLWIWIWSPPEFFPKLLHPFIEQWILPLFL